MNSKNSKITRRDLMIAGSAALAVPMAVAAVGTPAKAATTATDATKPAAGQTIYFIGYNCIGCQVCRMNCPASAIDFGDDRNVINQTKCIHCGTCYENCPLSAISAK